GGGGVLEEGRLLAVSVAAAAVVADFARTELVPGLRHVQHHAVLIERLEGPGHVSGDLGEEAGVGVAVRVERLLALSKLTHRDLAQDAHALLAVVVEQPPWFWATLAVGIRLQEDDADGVDIAVLVQAGIGALYGPIVRCVETAPAGGILCA